MVAPVAFITPVKSLAALVALICRPGWGEVVEYNFSLGKIMATLSIMQARKRVLDVLAETSSGGEVKITRRGKVVFDSGTSDRYPPQRGVRLDLDVDPILRRIRDNGKRGDADSIRRARDLAAQRPF